MLKHANYINGFTDLVMTKLDVLSNIKQLKIAVSYQLDGIEIDYIPASQLEFDRLVPNYQIFPG